jgi:hypothetical protein
LASTQRQFIHRSLPFRDPSIRNRYVHAQHAAWQARIFASTRSGAPDIGQWFHLLDPDRTKFDYHNGAAPYESVEDASDVYLSLFPSDNLRAFLNEQHHDLLTVDEQDYDAAQVCKMPYPSDVVADLYSDYDGAPELKHFVTCLLMTKSTWNPSLSLGELIVIAFVHVYTTCVFILRRSKTEQSDTRASSASGWAVVSRGFINQFAGYLCRVIVSGPRCNLHLKNRHLYCADSPLYAFVCVPVLRMFKRCSLGAFRVDDMFEASPDTFIKTFRDRARNFGCFSLAHLRDVISGNGHDDNFNFDFCKGVYLPLYRSLTLLSPALAFNKFDILNDTRNSIGRSLEPYRWMRISADEMRVLRARQGLKIRLCLDGVRTFWFHCHPVTEAIHQHLPPTPGLQFEEVVPEMDTDMV